MMGLVDAAQLAKTAAKKLLEKYTSEVYFGDDTRVYAYGIDSVNIPMIARHLDRMNGVISVEFRNP